MRIKSWNNRPVFISSTFADMQAERDYLRDIVFPELAERMKGLRCHLEPIDLRWGVETVNISERESKELLVLKVCLDEIERCRPFMIVLLGDRYGWVPPAPRMEAAVREKQFKTDIIDKSVTALEIEFGVLDSPEQKKRSFFYLREPLPYEEMLPQTAATFSEEYSNADGAENAYNNLQKLKKRVVEKMGAERVRQYTAGWDKEKGRLCGLESFGRQVIEDIWEELQEELKAMKSAGEPTWQEQERSVLDEFVEERSRNFMGRNELLNSLIKEAIISSGDKRWGTVITGEAGSGKSALFSMIAKNLENEDCLVLSNAAGISTHSGSVDFLLTRWTEELSDNLGIKIELAEKETLDEKQKRFAEMLSRASVQTRVVCLIDALNQFERTNTARFMTWLPEIWPKNGYLIAMTIPGDESETLGKRHGVATLGLPALDKIEAGEIIKTLCAYKTLNPEIIETLTEKKMKDGTPACGNPLWLSIAVQELLLLDEDDFERLGSYSGTNEEKLHALLKDTASSLPASVEGIYDFLFNRAGKRFGENYTEGLTGLIGISRHGLRETDLKETLPVLTGETWNDLQFAAFRRYFRAHMMQRGSSSQWDFMHAQMRISSMGRLGADQAKLKNMHRLIADHLEWLNDTDPVKESELMYHYIKADEKLRAARYYGRAHKENEKDGATIALADIIIEGIGKAPNPGVEWTLALLDQKALELEKALNIINNINFCLLEALKGNTDLGTRILLLDGNTQFTANLLDIEHTWLHAARDLVISNHKIGNLYKMQGNLEKAEDYIRKSFEMSKILHNLEPDSLNYMVDLIQSGESLGDLCLIRGETVKAEEYYRESFEMMEGVCKKEPDNDDNMINLTGSCDSLGKLYFERGETGKAVEYYNKSFEIRDRLLKRIPDSTFYARQLFVSCERLADIYIKSGETEKAEEYCHKSLVISENLYRSEPDNMEYAMCLSTSCVRNGDLCLRRGENGNAEEYYRKSFDIREKIHKQLPDSADYALALYANCDRLTVIYFNQVKISLAIEYCNKSFEISQDLHKRAPDSVEYAKDLSMSCNKLGDLYMACRDFAMSEEYLRKSLEINEEMYKRSPETAGFASDIMISYAYMAMCLIYSGKRNDAKKYFKLFKKDLLRMKKDGMPINNQLEESNKILESQF